MQFLTIEVLIKFMKQPWLLQHELNLENKSYKSVIGPAQVTIQVDIALTIVFSALLKYGFQPMLMTIL